MTGVDATHPGPEGDRAETDHDGPAVLASRRRRLSAYLRYNGGRICRDAAVVGVWALVMTDWSQGVGLPRWTYYVATFVGVVAYTGVTTTWSRPYASPDDLESVPATDRPLQESKQRHEQRHDPEERA